MIWPRSRRWCARGWAERLRPQDGRLSGAYVGWGADREDPARRARLAALRRRQGCHFGPLPGHCVPGTMTGSLTGACPIPPAEPGATFRRDGKGGLGLSIGHDMAVHLIGDHAMRPGNRHIDDVIGTARLQSDPVEYPQLTYAQLLRGYDCGSDWEPGAIVLTHPASNVPSRERTALRATDREVFMIMITGALSLLRRFWGGKARCQSPDRSAIHRSLPSDAV